MRAIVGIFIICSACGGGTAGNPDAPGRGDASPAIDAAIPDAAFCPALATIDVAHASEITVAGDAPAMGIFDPSLVYPADAPGGAMAYSAVPDQQTIRTHVALSADHGATWTFVAEANTPEPTSLTTTDMAECPGGTCSGNLISEVSSLIYDADAATGRVRRDSQGRAAVATELTAGQFDGACTFADGAGGTLLDIGFFQSPRPFRIYRPGV